MHNEYIKSITNKEKDKRLKKIEMEKIEKLLTHNLDTLSIMYRIEILRFMCIYDLDSGVLRLKNRIIKRFFDPRYEEGKSYIEDRLIKINLSGYDTDEYSE
jgi:hypothetical protein